MSDINRINVTINGVDVEIVVRKRDGVIFYSTNWIAVIDASHKNGDSRFSRSDDGPGTYGSTSIIFKA